MTSHGFIASGAHLRLENSARNGLAGMNAVASLTTDVRVLSVVQNSYPPNAQSITIEVMINVANRNAAESLVGALTSDHLNRVLALPYFHTVSIIEPWPVVEHRDVQAKSRGGEALSDLQLSARDKGGNILDESRNASITLREQTIIIQELMCKGQTHCHVPLNTSIPKGHTLIEANLDISLKCSDFDALTN